MLLSGNFFVGKVLPLPPPPKHGPHGATANASFFPLLQKIGDLSKINYKGQIKWKSEFPLLQLIILFLKLFLIKTGASEAWVPPPIEIIDIECVLMTNHVSTFSHAESCVPSELHIFSDLE